MFSRQTKSVAYYFLIIILAFGAAVGLIITSPKAKPKVETQVMELQLARANIGTILVDYQGTLAVVMSSPGNPGGGVVYFTYANPTNNVSTDMLAQKIARVVPAEDLGYGALAKIYLRGGKLPPQ